MTSRRTPTLAAVAFLVLLLALFYADLAIARIAVMRLALPATLAAATALAAIGVGRAVRALLQQRLFPDSPSGSPRLRYDFLVGYPLFGCAAFLAGLVSTGPIVQSAVLLGGVVLGAIALGTYRFRESPIPAGGGSLALASGVLATGALFTAFLQAQAPAFTLDEVAYHLAVPRQWAIAGRAIELPLLSHSYFPLAIESADLPSFALLGADGAIASHMLHLFAAIAAFAVLAIALPATASGLTAAVAIASTPALLLTAGWSWNEWPLVGLTLTALAAARAIAADDENGPGAAVFALALAGGFLTKYTFGAVGLVLVAALAAGAPDRRRRSILLRAVVAAAILGSTFLIRNLALTGNPLAPFFEHGAPALTGYRQAEGLGETLRLYLFSPRFIDEALGAALPLLALAALLFLPFLDRVSRLVVGGCVIVLAAATFAAPSSRLLLPPAVILAVIGARAAFREGDDAPRARHALAVLLLVAAALQLHLVAFQTVRSGAAQLILGLENEESLLAAQRRDYSRIRAIDAMAPPDSRTLVVGTAELFWFSREVRGGGNFDGPRVANLIRDPRLLERLRDDGITHIALFRSGLSGEDAQLDPKEEERTTRLDSVAAAALNRVLAERGRMIGSVGDAALYSISY
ncbi:MAG TPA: hypothetical protein VGF40_01220 [Thermoanaerobaculia bacterium]